MDYNNWWCEHIILAGFLLGDTFTLELTEWQIKNLHRLVLKGIDDAYAGRYRDQQVYIAGAEHIPPEPFLLKDYQATGRL